MSQTAPVNSPNSASGTGRIALVFILLVMLGGSLVAGVMVNRSIKGAVTQIPDSFKACEVDTDCASVRTAGCSCAPSGQYDQVNVIYGDRFTKPDDCSSAEQQTCEAAGPRIPVKAVCKNKMCMSEAEAFEAP